MKYIIILVCLSFTLNTYLLAQNNELITVKAGTRVLDYFPFQERYKYTEFRPGKVVFKKGIYTATKLNYNILMGEMQFIQARDTLDIANKKDVSYITVASDTFYYDKGYLELIYDSGPVKVTQKHYIKLKEVQKKDAYGIATSGSSTQSYKSLPFDGRFYQLVVNEDVILQNKLEFYISTPTSGFVSIRKNTVMKLFPQKTDAIKDYLKSNEVDFDSRDDLIRLAGFLRNL